MRKTEAIEPVISANWEVNPDISFTKSATHGDKIPKNYKHFAIPKTTRTCNSSALLQLNPHNERGRSKFSFFLGID